MHDLDQTMMEYEGAFESEFEYDAEQDDYEDSAVGAQLEEAEEMELAGELLTVSDDQELDQFLGKLFKKATKGVGRFLKSKTGQALGGMLRGVARKALPIVGGALGNFVLPGVGGAAGSNLAAAAGQMFGLELEGLAPEDQEFETARSFVRLAADAAANAARSDQGGSPAQAARAALTAAARKHAPGLLRSGPMGSQQQSGRWIRRGNKIILIGA